MPYSGSKGRMFIDGIEISPEVDWTFIPRRPFFFLLPLGKILTEKDHPSNWKEFKVMISYEDVVKTIAGD